MSMNTVEDYWRDGSLYRDLIISKKRLYQEDIAAFNQKVDKFTSSSHGWEELRTCINTVSFDAVEDTLWTFLYGQEKTVQEVIAVLANCISHKTVGYTMQLHIASKLIGYLQGSTFTLTKGGDTYFCSSKYELTEEEEEAKHMAMYPPPLMEVPAVVPKILGHHTNKHQYHLCEDAIELLQAIAWTLDPYIASMQMESNKEEFETPDEADAWMHYSKVTKELHDEYLGKSFYFNWAYDKRGRQYMQGYHISLQSIKYNKAILSFGNKHKIEGEL